MLQRLEVLCSFSHGRCHRDGLHRWLCWNAKRNSYSSLFFCWRWAPILWLLRWWFLLQHSHNTATAQLFTLPLFHLHGNHTCFIWCFISMNTVSAPCFIAMDTSFISIATLHVLWLPYMFYGYLTCFMDTKPVSSLLCHMPPYYLCL